MHWRLHPNGGRVAGIAIPKAEAARLVERGWVTVNGERAVIEAHTHDETYNAALRIAFDRPYPYPHP